MGITGGPFIDACFGRNKDRIPVWVMRQAGRYLPEYRAVREKASFQELCRSPELIAEVVHQPIERFGFDAAIVFSDILTVLEPMGMKVEFPDGGPRITNPIESPDDVDKLTDIDAEHDLSFVLDGFRAIKKRLPDTPLIGFVGSPFTLSCYMIEGKGSKTFDKARRFHYEHPRAGAKLIQLLAEVLAKYLVAQVKAGADALQLFESWGGVLSRQSFQKLSIEPAGRIFDALKSTGVPRIYFVNNLAPYVDRVATVDCEVVGVDYRMDLARAARTLSGKAVQGNLDPSLLFAGPDETRTATRKILDSLESHDNVIFNLGHGIQPKAPIESVTALVETVHAYRG